MPTQTVTQSHHQLVPAASSLAAWAPAPSPQLPSSSQYRVEEPEEPAPQRRKLTDQERWALMKKHADRAEVLDCFQTIQQQKMAVHQKRMEYYGQPASGAQPLYYQ
eukprot:NODE_3649_length_867_cov_9.814865_g3627_i0.p2 GENE.NODE_3649_length_867_cov_9.814865_g3627_i0~~NODE_3649_length_867_cov_9.814865_g3627_i0.p2  ORF type:complete len:106 (-),score=21.59 NODE_3649_length_867_cov_9.814865_g3627_i0:67-384(-)